MRDIYVPEFIKGPLGSHKNYIRHIALPNFIDYENVRTSNREEGRKSSSDKYREFRLYLNSIESFNNILEYFYYEFEQRIDEQYGSFRRRIHNKYPILFELEKIANAYKHCIRYDFKNKSKDSNAKWARDLQSPEVNLSINLTSKQVSVEYKFEWPIEHQEVLVSVWQFWLDYDNSHNSEKIFLE